MPRNLKNGRKMNVGGIGNEIDGLMHWHWPHRRMKWRNDQKLRRKAYGLWKKEVNWKFGFWKQFNMKN